jgi:hypothetical protein
MDSLLPNSAHAGRALHSLGRHIHGPARPDRPEPGPARPARARPDRPRVGPPDLRGRPSPGPAHWAPTLASRPAHWLNRAP